MTSVNASEVYQSTEDAEKTEITEHSGMLTINYQLSIINFLLVLRRLCALCGGFSHDQQKKAEPHGPALQIINNPNVSIMKN
jgi:hypothetical protein